MPLLEVVNNFGFCNSKLEQIHLGSLEITCGGSFYGNPMEIVNFPFLTKIEFFNTFDSCIQLKYFIALNALFIPQKCFSKC